MDDNKKDLKIALVLSGGGAKGAYQAGVIDQIHKRLGLQYEVVSGVSVGNLNGAMVAQDKVDELVNIWKNISDDKVYKKKSVLKVVWQFVKHKIGIGNAPFSVYNNDPLKKLISKHLVYEDLVTDFLSGRVSLNTGEYKNDLDADNFIDQVLASTAIPMIWKPVEFDDQQWVDGGVRNVTPLSDVLNYNPDLIIIIPTQWYSQKRYASFRGSGDKGKTLDIIEVADRTLGTIMNETFMNDLDNLIRINELVGQAERKDLVLKKENGKPFKYYECLIIPPTMSMGDPLNFDHDVTMKRFEHGIKRGKRSVRLLREIINKLQEDRGE